MDLWSVEKSWRPDERIIRLERDGVIRREAIEDRRLAAQPDPVAWLWERVQQMAVRTGGDHEQSH